MKDEALFERAEEVTGRHPMQPVEWDGCGVLRFRENPIVRYVLEKGGIDLNDLARVSVAEGWKAEDHSHFAQLIGYSVSGWSGLSYVSASECVAANRRCATVLAAHPTDPARDGAGVGR